jgi:hypothetical protein
MAWHATDLAVTFEHHHSAGATLAKCDRSAEPSGAAPNDSHVAGQNCVHTHPPAVRGEAKYPFVIAASFAPQ